MVWRASLSRASTAFESLSQFDLSRHPNSMCDGANPGLYGGDARGGAVGMPCGFDVLEGETVAGDGSGASGDIGLGGVAGCTAAALPDDDRGEVDDAGCMVGNEGVDSVAGRWLRARETRSKATTAAVIRNAAIQATFTPATRSGASPSESICTTRAWRTAAERRARSGKSVRREVSCVDGKSPIADC